MVKSRLLAAVGIVALAGSIAGVLAAQAPDSPAFEVASIKLNKSGPPRSGKPDSPGRFTATFATLSGLIQNAYRVHEAQVIGGPSWMRSDRYDVAAIGLVNATVEQRMAMWQKLLAERFALEVHHETRILPAANLVMARSDRKFGPHLQRATDADADCTSKSPSDVSNGKPPCSQQFSIGRFSARGITMERLAQTLVLSLRASPFVFDETQLAGAFNIDLLEWRPDGVSPEPPPDRGPNTPPWPSVDAPSIYTALQDQLGLKLEFIKGPVDVLVIDHLEHPSED
jgi:uncharacterized protein (TIGR03435 family)